MRRFLERDGLIAAGGALLAALVVAVVYWPARQNGFVWDDWAPLVDNPVFRDPARWREALFTPPIGDAVAFRPVAMLSFMLQLWAGHTTPAPFHLANVALHAASVFLLVLFAWRFLLDATAPRAAAVAAAVSGLAYGLHPALAEPVVWISCRYDLLMTLFLLVALLLDRALPQSGYARVVAVSAAFMAAALSKETAIGFLLALPLVHIAIEQLRGGSDRAVAVLSGARWVYAALFCVGVFYLAARGWLAGPTLGMQRMADQYADVGSIGQRALGAAASLGQLTLDALWPFKPGVPSRSLTLPLKWTDALTIVPALLVFVVALFCARRSREGRTLLVLLLALMAALLPVSNLFPLPGIYGELWVATRYLAFPLVLLFLAAPLAFLLAGRWMAAHASRLRILLWLVVGVWIAASAMLVRVTIPLWKDDGAMNSWAIANGAHNYWRYSNLGDYYLKQKQPKRAREAFIRALDLRGDIAKSWYYLGFTEAELGNMEAARDHLRSAILLGRNLLGARLVLAKLELGQGNPRLAAEILEQGLDRLPYADDPSQNGAYRYLLGITYIKLGRNEAAAAQLDAALRLAQDDAERGAAEAALRSIAPARK